MNLEIPTSKQHSLEAPQLNTSMREWDQQSSSTFWKNLKSIAIIFENRCQLQKGNGKRISFCHFNWGFEILKHNISTIFLFALDQDIT
jgi:hypothetical protein